MVFGLRSGKTHPVRTYSRGPCFARFVLVALVAGLAAVFLAGCGSARAFDSTPGTHGGGGAAAALARPSPTPAREMPTARAIGTQDGAFADSLFPEEKSPGAGSYVLYGLVGFPRDAVATVLEPVGYGVGAIGGPALYIVSLPLQMLYTGEIGGMRPVARGCVMGISFPFFFTSDIVSRSFTGDMNRYRWGVHPFPRTDNRFFPNYHAILGD